MEIALEIRKELYSFEFCQLQKFLETLELNLLYSSGYDNSLGGYANAEAFGILEGEEYDEATDTWIDFIEIETEVGESTGSTTHCTKSCHKLLRTILTDDSPMREKITKLQEA